MAETKLAVIILNLLGIPFVGFVLFVAPINFIQATVVWALVVIFLTARIYFYIKWGIQKTRNNELDIIERENNLIKKIDTDED